MTTTMQRASLVIFTLTLAGSAAAQGAAPAHPAPAPAPPPAAAPPPPAAPPAAAPPPGGVPAPPPPGMAPPPPGAAPPPPGMAPLAPSSMYEPPPPLAYQPPPPPPTPPSGTEAYVGGAMVGFVWDLGIPIGTVHNFTSNVSGLGFDILFRYWLHKQFTIGGDVEWQTFVDQRDRTTYPITNGALTATSYNSVQTASLRLAGNYYFLDEGPVLPFVGLNVGYAWATFEAAAADILVYDNQESVVFGGELGAALALGGPSAPLIYVGGRYSAEPGMEFLKATKDIQTITFQLGLMLR